MLRTCFLLELFADVKEAGTDEESLEKIFVEHLPDLGSRRVEDVSLHRHLRSDEVVVVANLRF